MIVDLIDLYSGGEAAAAEGRTSVWGSRSAMTPLVWTRRGLVPWRHHTSASACLKAPSALLHRKGVGMAASDMEVAACRRWPAGVGLGVGGLGIPL
jgi:hypothetical protein